MWFFKWKTQNRKKKYETKSDQPIPYVKYKIQVTTYKSNLTESTRLRCWIFELLSVFLIPTKSIYTSMDGWVLNHQHLQNPPRIELRSIRLWVLPKDFNLDQMNFRITLEREYEAQWILQKSLKCITDSLTN